MGISYRLATVDPSHPVLAYLLDISEFPDSDDDVGWEPILDAIDTLIPTADSARVEMGRFAPEIDAALGKPFAPKWWAWGPDATTIGPDGLAYVEPGNVRRAHRAIDGLGSEQLGEHLDAEVERNLAILCREWSQPDWAASARLVARPHAPQTIEAALDLARTRSQHDRPEVLEVTAQVVALIRTAAERGHGLLYEPII